MTLDDGSNPTDPRRPKFTAVIADVELEALRLRLAMAQSDVLQRYARCLALKARLLERLATQAARDAALQPTLTELRAAVGRYVQVLKNKGESADRVLLLVKEAVGEGSPSRWPQTRDIVDFALISAAEAYEATTAA
jgi:hypothetical protein